MDTKPVSHGWSVTEPFSGALIDGAVYGHGVMDMKAALACQIVAIEAVRASGLPARGTLAMAAVSDHMGDQLGSIAYFDTHPADLCVLGRAHRQPGVPGASRPLLLRRHHARSLGAHVPQAAGDQRERPGRAGRPGPGRVEVRARPPRTVGGRPVRRGDVRRAGTDLRRSPAGRSVDDPGRVRDPRGLPAAAGRVDRGGPRGGRSMPRGGGGRPTRASPPTSCSPTSKSGYLADPDDEVVRLMRTAVREVRGGEEPPLVVENWLGRHGELRREGARP